MVKMHKQPHFSLNIERFFTRDRGDAFDLIHFSEVDAYGDETMPVLEAPDNWSAEAASLLAEEAAHRSIPAETKYVEENTVPSWLWRRVGEGKEKTSETSVKQIFHRVAGAATYTAWKKDFFANESEARIFFDEVRYLLAQRLIALEPSRHALSGLDWAYGIESSIDQPNQASAVTKFESGDFKEGKPAIVDIRNASIDALLAGNKTIRRKWQKYIDAGINAGFLSLRFTDISSDWTGGTHAPIRAAIDLLAFRRDDGLVDIDRLCHAVKLLVIVLALQSEVPPRQIALGIHNLSPLLMSQAIAYDSEAGRMTAAALAAIVSAEAYAVSAQLAGLLGSNLETAENREAIIRAMRNHRRAAYGDHNDYEKISVLPVPLTVDTGADLTLIAAARRLWDEALVLVQKHGLFFTRLSDLSAATGLAFFMESTTQGVAPMPGLAVPRATESGVYRRELHPSVGEALAKLGYDQVARHSITAHIAGHKTLLHSLVINHDALRRRGFDTAALESVDEYLPNVGDIRFAFTPWILGENLYKTLKIPTAKINDARFDLLHHLGFSDNDIATANTFVYGHATAVGAKGLRPTHTGIFAHDREAGSEARIKMAAAVQGLISGDAGLQTSLPVNASAEDCERLLLNVWRQGVKSVSVEFSGPAKRAAPHNAAAVHKKPVKKISAKQSPHYTGALGSARRTLPKASGGLVSHVGSKSAATKKRGTTHKTRGN